MNEAAKAARREYKKAWNAANRDKVKRYQENYWSKKAAQAAEENDNEQSADTQEAGE